MGSPTNNQLTIVQIIRSAQTGGVERHVLDLLRHAQRKHFYTILIVLVNSPINSEFLKLNIPIIVLNDYMWMSSKSFLNIINLYKQLRKVRPDIVHLHGTRPIFIGSIACKLASIQKIFITYHNSYKLMAYSSDATINNKLLFASKIMHSIGFLLAQKVIFVANALKDDIYSITFNSRILSKAITRKSITIHNGINVEDYYHKNTKNNQSPDGEINLPIICTIARLDEPMKGISILLKAARLSFDKGHKFKILVAGDGEHKKELIKLSQKLNIDRYVVFLGFINNIPELLSRVDIFVLPSLSEGFPIVNIEAMAASLPIITTDVGGSSEAVVDNYNGFVVKKGKIGELSNSINLLVANYRLRIIMGERSKKIAIKYFQQREQLKNTFGLYVES